MNAAQRTVETYIRAKDENRPYLMASAFAEDAVLEVVVNTGAISLPPTSYGLDSITDVLVRRFAQTYENVHTFCLASPPRTNHIGAFSCSWLVAMSDKEARTPRVGCGRYSWLFRSNETRLAERLSITVDVMEILPIACLGPVMKWACDLPRPWCTSALALERAPRFDELGPIREHLSHASA